MYTISQHTAAKVYDAHQKAENVTFIGLLCNTRRVDKTPRFSINNNDDTNISDFNKKNIYQRNGHFQSCLTAFIHLAWVVETDVGWSSENLGEAMI